MRRYYIQLRDGSGPRDLVVQALVFLLVLASMGREEPVGERRNA